MTDQAPPLSDATVADLKGMEARFQVGDIVTRDGTDRQRVLWVSGDLIEVECIREPLGFLQEDGMTREQPWCRVGDRESCRAVTVTLTT